MEDNPWFLLALLSLSCGDYRWKHSDKFLGVCHYLGAAFCLLGGIHQNFF